MNNQRISQRLEHQIERINAKLESTRNPARRKQLRERKWALKSRLRGSYRVRPGRGQQEKYV